MYVCSLQQVAMILPQDIHMYVRTYVCKAPTCCSIYVSPAPSTVSDTMIYLHSMASSDARFPSSFRMCLFSMGFRALRWNWVKDHQTQMQCCGLCVVKPTPVHSEGHLLPWFILCMYSFGRIIRLVRLIVTTDSQGVYIRWTGLLD